MNFILPDTSNTSLQRPSIRVAKAAALLEVNISTIYRLVRSGELEAHRVGKRGIRIYFDSLRRYQEQRTIVVDGKYKTVSETTESKHSVKHSAYHEAIAYLQSKGCL